MNDVMKTKKYAELNLQINRNIAITVMMFSILAVLLLPDGFTGYVFSVLVYSGLVLLLTLPTDYMLPVFHIAAEFFAELLHRVCFTRFCFRYRITCALLFGASSLLLWLPLFGVLFSQHEELYLMLFLVYAVIWTVFFHASAVIEQKEFLADGSVEIEEQHSTLFWIVWRLLFSGCVTGCILPLIPYITDYLSGKPAQVTSFQLFLEAVSMAGIILLSITAIVYRRHEKAIRQTLEHMQIQHQIEQNQMYIKLLTEKYRSLQQYQHDFKKHLTYIRQLAVQKQPEDIIDYIESVQDDLQRGTLLRLTGIQTLDLLLSDYTQQAESNGVHLQIQYQPQTRLQHIRAADLCIILGNLLDNAITAASASEAKQVMCTFGMKNEYYTMVRISNTCAHAPVMKAGVPQPLKEREGHGYGVQNVLRCAEKYHAICNFFYEEEHTCFQAVLLIPH